MTLDTSDPAIHDTYNHILSDRSKDWLILAYSKTRDTLRLADSGVGGPDGLRTHITPYSNDVSFSLVCLDGPDSLVLICYIPAAIGGVKRARAIVHERALEDVFPARRAVLNVSAAADITVAAVERAIRSAPPSIRKRVPVHNLPIAPNRPMSPPSSEDGRASLTLPHANIPPPLAQPIERGLPLNLPESLDPERRREIEKEHQEEIVREQLARASRVRTPTGDGSGSTRNSGSKLVKPQLSVAVPPRGERGLLPIKYDGDDHSFDTNDDDGDEEDEEEESHREQLVVLSHSRPSSRGPTPPPGPSILRHPSPIPSRPDLRTSATNPPGASHIRFTGPPKDHPHPDHHPLKPTDQVVPAVRSGEAFAPVIPQSLAPADPIVCDHPTLQHPSNAFTTPEGALPVAKPPPVSGSPPNTAQPWLPPVISSEPVSQLEQPRPSLDASSTSHTRPPPQSLLAAAGTMPPTISPNALANRPLPPSPFSVRPGTANPSGHAVHSRNSSASNSNGQTHVPSGTLSAFGRRSSLSKDQQNGVANPSPALLAQMSLASPSALLELSSTHTSGASSSTSGSYRPVQVQTQGMTEAQAQAARSRAKWAAEEQGLPVAAPTSGPIGLLPRSPPLTPPMSPPRSLGVDEADRVRRDGVEKMRREAERRREEDEKRRIAEEKQKAEDETRLRLDEERKEREAKEMAEREVKRKKEEEKRQLMQQEQEKRRAEERAGMRQKFEQMKGGDGVFLTGHVNVQPGYTMSWKWRFYELTVNGRLLLYKSSDDRTKPLDIIQVKDAKRINYSADELEQISYAFRLELSSDEESWSFYSDSQHDMTILTEGMTLTMNL